uniref:hypothetical protein n=1 Tax=Streptomyces albus TaxID=1888 RepID=UPI001B802136
MTVMLQSRNAVRATAHAGHPAREPHTPRLLRTAGTLAPAPDAGRPRRPHRPRHRGRMGPA